MAAVLAKCKRVVLIIDDKPKVLDSIGVSVFLGLMHYFKSCMRSVVMSLKG